MQLQLKYDLCKSHRDQILVFVSEDVSIAEGGAEDSEACFGAHNFAGRSRAPTRARHMPAQRQTFRREEVAVLSSAAGGVTVLEARRLHFSVFWVGVCSFGHRVPGTNPPAR